MRRYFLGAFVLGFTITATDALAQSYTSPYPNYGSAITSPGPMDGFSGGYPVYSRPGLPSTSPTGVVSPNAPGGFPGNFDPSAPLYDTLPPQPRRLGWRLFGWRRGGFSTPYVGDTYGMTYP